MKRNPYWFSLLSLSLLLASWVLPMNAAAQAAAESQTVQISGLQEGESIHLYQLTTAEQWAAPVQAWLDRENAPAEFRDFGKSPELLFRLQTQTQDRFVQLLVLAMRDTGANLILEDLGSRLTWNTETKNWEGAFSPGGYLLLPSSSQRIYSPRLLLVSDTQAEISYKDRYFSQPSFSMTVSTEEGEALTDQSFLVQGRKLMVRTELNPERYPAFFPAEKLVRILSFHLGPGQIPVLEKATVQEADLGFALQEGRDYTLESVSNVTVYTGADHASCFYEDNGLFYFMDGSATGTTTLAGTLDAYNLRYGMALTETELKSVPSSTVVFLTLARWDDPLVFEYPVTIGNTYLPQESSQPAQVGSGIALLEGQYHFTASVLPADPLGQFSELRQYTNYSVEAQLLDGGIAGDGQTQVGTPLTGGAFTLYRLYAKAEFAAGASQEEKNAWIQQAVDVNPGQGYQVLWLDNQVSLYLFHSAQAVDAQGITGFGALEPEEYLMVETIYPDGYATLRTAYQITPVAWEHDSFQTVTWRNYTGVYLPETGGIGTAAFTMTGTSLLMFGMFLMIWTIRRKKET